MIWFFLALVILAIVFYQILKNAKKDAKVAQIKQKNVEWANRRNNQIISDMMSQYSVASILSVIQKAKHEAEVSGGTFTLASDVERSLQAKIEEEKKAAHRDARLVDAICLAFEGEASTEDTSPTEGSEAGTSFQASLRTINETGFQDLGKRHLETLKKLSEEVHQQVRLELCQKAQNRGSALSAGETLRARLDLPLPISFDDRALFDLMQFVGFQVEGYDLISKFGPGDLLVWRHRKLLDVYISLIQKECAADGIQVSYEAQYKDGFDGVPVTVSLPYRITEKPRSDICTNVALCVSCKV